MLGFFNIVLNRAIPYLSSCLIVTPNILQCSLDLNPEDSQPTPEFSCRWSSLLTICLWSSFFYWGLLKFLYSLRICHTIWQIPIDGGMFSTSLIRLVDEQLGLYLLLTTWKRQSLCLLWHHFLFTKGGCFFSREESCSTVWVVAQGDPLTVDVAQVMWLIKLSPHAQSRVFQWQADVSSQQQRGTAPSKTVLCNPHW